MKYNPTTGLMECKICDVKLRPETALESNPLSVIGKSMNDIAGFNRRNQEENIKRQAESLPTSSYEYPGCIGHDRRSTAPFPYRQNNLLNTIKFDQQLDTLAQQYWKNQDPERDQ